MTIAQTLARTFTRALTGQQIFRQGWEDWGASASGVSVTPTSAMHAPPFYSGVRMLASDIASCPVDIVRKDGSRRITVPPPPWMRWPTTDPNDSWLDHMADAVTSLLTDGNLFTLAVPSVEDAIFVYVLDPAKCAIVRHGQVPIAYYVDGVEVSPAQLIHIPLIKPPGRLRGLGPVEAGREVIGEGLAAQEYAARFFSNGALLDVVIEAPATMGDSDLKRLASQMRRRHTGVRNSHAIGVLTGGARINRMGVNPSEAQLLELRKHNVQDQARLLGVPSFMLGDVTPGAVSYASTEVSDRRYIRQGVTPLVVRIEDGYQRLLPDGHQVKVNLAGLMRGDRKARWETHQIGVANRIVTIDEVRGWEDLVPADEAPGIDSENGGFLDTPNSMMPGAQPADDEPPAPEPDPDQEPET